MSILWIIAAALLGYGIAATFAGKLKLQRDIYLLFYIPLVSVLILAFIRLNAINIKETIAHNWGWGLIAALIAGVLVIRNVMSQPSSEPNKGMALVSDILWPGAAYGLIDALLLSVLPILAIRLLLTGNFWVGSWVGRICLGSIGLIASFFVTTLYHLGYPEFRGKKVIWPNIGNGVLSLAYLLTMNPLAAILPHIAMHIAAMVHGRETTGQVPPHYTD